MKDILNSLKYINYETDGLPFSVYSSVYEQKLLNVPISKPLLIVVINGNKQLGQQQEIVCKAGDFIFLPNSPAINMRNIPSEKSYLALLIEFDYDDFKDLPNYGGDLSAYVIGETTETLQQCLRQYIECSAWASEAILSLRKQEILLLLYHLGYKQVASMMGKPKLSHKLHNLFYVNNFSLHLDTICTELAVSESTLRRKLIAEGTNIKAVRDNARLGFALHLLQTTNSPISIIAEKSGYSSQSRFTDRFKGHFGLTPSALRKTKLTG